MTAQDQIRRFLEAPSFAVVGASEDPRKFGHRIFACYLQHGFRAYPVNPNASSVLGQPSFASISALPEPVRAVSVVTPPFVTERVIDEIIAAGVTDLWLQPGAESAAAVRKAQDAGMNVIYGGPCLLVALNR